MANKKQIQLIHVAKQNLNIDDEDYRYILSNYNVKSSKDLSEQQAEHLLHYFRTKGFKVQKRRATVIKNDKIVKIASIAQHKLINVLKANVAWQVSYEAWLKSRMRMDSVLTAQQAFKVIEGLKGMLNINTKDIEFLRLPFPDQYNIEEITEKWFFDTQNNKLVYVKNGEICRTIQ